MSAEKNISQPVQEVQARKRWTTPDIQMLDLNAARDGGANHVADGTMPNRS